MNHSTWEKEPPENFLKGFKMNFRDLVIRVPVFFLLFLILSLPLYADVKYLTEENARILQEASAGRIIYSAAELPSSIIKLFTNEKGGLTDTLEEWEPTCAPKGKLPGYRLIWAVHLRNYYILHYQSGDSALENHVILVSLASKNKPEVLWRASGGLFETYKDFLTALEQKKISDF